MQDPYLNYNKCYSRLRKELEKYKTLYIAFDFDNTIFDFHNEGHTYPKVEEQLWLAKNEGFKLILFTSDDNPEKLKKKIDYCEIRGYKPDYVNENPEIFATKKPYYNLLLDDRAGLRTAYNLLRDIINYKKLCGTKQSKICKQ